MTQLLCHGGESYAGHTQLSNRVAEYGRIRGTLHVRAEVTIRMHGSIESGGRRGDPPAETEGAEGVRLLILIRMPNRRREP